MSTKDSPLCPDCSEACFSRNSGFSTSVFSTTPLNTLQEKRPCFRHAPVIPIVYRFKQIINVPWASRSQATSCSRWTERDSQHERNTSVFEKWLFERSLRSIWKFVLAKTYLFSFFVSLPEVYAHVSANANVKPPGSHSEPETRLFLWTLGWSSIPSPGFRATVSNPNGLLSQKLCPYLDQSRTLNDIFLRAAYWMTYFDFRKPNLA